MLKKALEDEFHRSDPLQDFPSTPSAEAAPPVEVELEDEDSDIMDDI